VDCPGAHVNAVGACTPAARELDTAAVRRARFFGDRRESVLKEAGDFLIPLQEGSIAEGHLLGDFGDLLLGRVQGRLAPEDVTVFRIRWASRSRTWPPPSTSTPRHWRRGGGFGWSFRRRPRMRTLSAPTIDDIRAARERLAGVVLRTPLVRLNVDGPNEIYLKLENLQPIGSFKLRGRQRHALAGPERLAKGVYTASAGNMAQGWRGAPGRSGCRRRSSCPSTRRRPSSPPSSGWAAGTSRVPFEQCGRC